MILLDLLIYLIHMNDSLNLLIQNYGNLIYGLLFLIIFLETGFVLTIFLPGDTLLFTVGAVAAIGNLDFGFILFLLIFAAISGGFFNYFIGKNFGIFLINKKLVSKKSLEKTHEFYEKYGVIAIFLARFFPIIRTIAPFFAGMSKMDYKTFTIYNILGGIIWISIFLGLGFFFGNIPIIKENFGLIVLGILTVSVIPLILEYLRKRNKKC